MFIRKAMTSLCLVIGISILIGACVSGPVSGNSALEVPDERVFDHELTTPGPGKVEVIVTVDEKLWAGYIVVCKIIIRVDYVKVADIRRGERISLFITPGKHTINAYLERRVFYQDDCYTSVDSEIDVVQGYAVAWHITDGWSVGQQNKIALVPVSLDDPEKSGINFLVSGNQVEFEAFSMLLPPDEPWDIVDWGSNHIVFHKQFDSPDRAMQCEITAGPRYSKAQTPEAYLAEFTDKSQPPAAELKTHIPELDVKLDPRFGDMSVKAVATRTARKNGGKGRPFWDFLDVMPIEWSAARTTAYQFIHPHRPDTEMSIYAKYFGLKGDDYVGVDDFERWCFDGVQLKLMEDGK